MNKKNKAVILARVSSKAQEDEGYSLDSQVKLLTGYCENKGFAVERVFKIAETASKEQSRKIFKELLTYMNKNGIFHLAVEKTDRLTRNMKDAVAIDDWLSKNVDRMLHLVKEGIHLHKESKSDVKFMWNIHLAVAKKYTDNLREEAMKGWTEKLAQGWLPAVPPIGYMTISDHGKRIHIPNPSTEKLVQSMFETYLLPGQSIESITKKMRDLGLTTRQGRPLVTSHVHKTLQNPFYIGVNRFNGQEYPGVQTPIIRKEVWVAVQEKLHGKRRHKHIKHNMALKGVVTCATCGNQVSWQLQKGNYYGACQRRDSRCKKCKYKYVREDKVQEIIKKELASLLCPSENVMKWTLDNMRSDITKVADNSDEIKNATESRIRRIESMDEALYDDKLAGAITLDRYETKHKSFIKEIEALELTLNNLDDTIVERKRRGIYLLELSQGAAKYYEEKDADEKRQILLELFDNITINDGSIEVKLKDQIELISRYSSKTRDLLKNYENNDRTFTDKENNRLKTIKNNAELALHPIWQGHVESNHDLRFWRPTY